MESEHSRNKNIEQKTFSGGWPILLIGLVLTHIVAFYVYKKNESVDRLKIDYEINTIIKRVQARMNIYEGAVIQLRAYLLNSNFSSADIRQFIKDAQIFKRSPGLQALGYTVMIPKHKLNQHIQEMRKEFPDYQFWPKGERNHYTSVIFIESKEKTEIQAIGYDMFQEPTRREAMMRARDHNEAALTRKIIFAENQDYKNIPGMNFYLPYYQKGAPVRTVEERRKALLGYFFNPFRIDRLFNTIFSEIKMDLDVEIYEGDDHKKENLIFDFNPKVKSYDYYHDVNTKRKISLYGTDFTFRFSPLASFNEAATKNKILFVMGAGLICTLVVFWIWYLTQKQMEVVSQVANEREYLLRKEKEHVASRDEFLSIASHELKTPLTSLKLKAQMMMRAINKNDQNALSIEKISSLVNLINTQSTRLTRLVDDMLDLSRIRTGRLKIEKQEVNLPETVKEVVDRLGSEFFEVTGRMPIITIDEEIKGYWDRLRIEQVLTNLFTNALRYGNHQLVTIHVSRKGKWAKVKVVDHGIGIAKDNISRIFERFERAGIAASEVSGLGVGLFISNKIVLAHGGKILVESELGKGSTFTMELPLEDQKHA